MEVPQKNTDVLSPIPILNTWHGLERKKIKIERRSVQINYVTFETDWGVER